MISLRINGLPPADEEERSKWWEQQRQTLRAKRYKTIQAPVEVTITIHAHGRLPGIIGIGSMVCTILHRINIIPSPDLILGMSTILEHSSQDYILINIEQI